MLPGGDCLHPLEGLTVVEVEGGRGGEAGIVDECQARGKGELSVLGGRGGVSGGEGGGDGSRHARREGGREKGREGGRTCRPPQRPRPRPTSVDKAVTVAVAPPGRREGGRNG